MTSELSVQEMRDEENRIFFRIHKKNGEIYLNDIEDFLRREDCPISLRAVSIDVGQVSENGNTADIYPADRTN